MAWWEKEELKPLEDRSDRYKRAFPEYYEQVPEYSGRGECCELLNTVERRLLSVLQSLEMKGVIKPIITERGAKYLQGKEI